MNTTSNNLNLTRGYVIALISAGILSTTAIFIRYLTETYQIPALVLAFWRDCFVVFTLLLAGIRNPGFLRLQRQHWPYLITYGLVLAAFNSTWTLAVALNGAAVSTVLVYSSAGFTALLGWWFLKERLGWAKVLAIMLSLGGCVLVSGALDLAVWRSNFLGLLTGIVSGLCYAGYSLMGRSAAQRGINPWTTLIYTFSFAACFLLLLNLLPGGFLPGTATRLVDFLWLGDAWVGWGVLFLLGAGPTVLGFGLYNVSLSYLPSSIANLIVTLEPAFTSVLAYVVLEERMTGVQIAGSLMIVMGVFFLRVYEGWRAGQLPFGRRRKGQPILQVDEERVRG